MARVQTSPEVARAAAWLNSYPKASKWMRRYDLLRLLDEGGGIVRMEGFLPPFVAEAVLQVLEAIPTSQWNPTAAGEDYSHNNISHAFYSTKHASAIIDATVRVISLLLPGQLNAFSAARYDATHHIAPHDDRAYTPVRLDTGEVITCSREIGVIWYLTKDWREEYGGALVDLEAPGAPRSYVPLFNSAIAFRVPRYHEVTPLAAPRPRFSLFGWFLQPGKRYELYLGEDEQVQQAQHAQQAGRLSLSSGGGGSSSSSRGQGKRRHRAGAEGGREAEAEQQERGEAEGEQKDREGAEAADGGQAVHACKLARRIAARAAKRRRQGKAAGGGSSKQ